MKIKDYKCNCGHDDFFFADKGSQQGLYCSYCGKWFKWADKDEQNLKMKPEKTGKWIDDSRTLPLSDAVKHCVRCSNCGTHWDYATRYCPYCGIKMEENENE